MEDLSNSWDVVAADCEYFVKSVPFPDCSYSYEKDSLPIACGRELCPILKEGK